MEQTQRVGQILRGSLIKNIKDGFDDNKNVFLLSYSAISSSQMDTMRKALKQTGVSVYVSQNRLAKLALKELEKDSLADGIKGQTAFVWGNEDCVEISKSLVKFQSDYKGLVVNGGFVEGSILSEGDIKRLSELPSKPVLQSQLLATIVAPLTRLARAMNAKSQDLLSILKQLSEKKGG